MFRLFYNEEKTMITTKKLWELFEVSWLMMRQNPGGKSPYLQGHLLGFAGTIDIMDSIDPARKTGKIKIKVGDGAVQTKTVDFSDASPEALTPSAAVIVLNDAGFEGCTFSLDAKTNRLKLAPNAAGVKWIQIYGNLAAALNFGNCRNGEGKGCYLWASFDGDLKSVAETEERSEDKKIVNDSPLGVPVTYTAAGKRGGTQIVVTDRLSSREAKQMINGGTWLSGDVDTPETYEPPVASDNDPRRVDVFTYSKICEKNDNTEGDEKFIRERMYIGGIGHMNRTGGAGSWSDGEYTLTFGTYMDDGEKEHASPKESDYTVEQWEALNLSRGIIEMDWENA
jgi:hypothetical protein